MLIFLLDVKVRNGGNYYLIWNEIFLYLMGELERFKVLVEIMGFIWKIFIE